MNGILLNWYVGWGLMLSGLLVGAGMGLFFHDDDFLGGYSSFRRRLFRLGHIACVALGVLNVLAATVFLPLVPGRAGLVASGAFAIGAVLMPVLCFLSGWRAVFRFGLVLPVASLLIGVVAVLVGGVPCV
jgi:hypothetical protein